MSLYLKAMYLEILFSLFTIPISPVFGHLESWGFYTN